MIRFSLASTNDDNLLINDGLSSKNVKKKFHVAGKKKSKLTRKLFPEILPLLHSWSRLLAFYRLVWLERKKGGETKGSAFSWKESKKED